MKGVGESKTPEASAGDDMLSRKNPAMADGKMDDRRSALWLSRFQVKVDPGDSGGVVDERHAKTLEPPFLIYIL